MPDRGCRAVLKEFTDGVDLAELEREFQSETVLGKKRKLVLLLLTEHIYVQVTHNTVLGANMC